MVPRFYKANQGFGQRRFLSDKGETIRALCRASLFEECSQHHGHKGDPRVMPGTCGAIGERAQVILVWMRAPGRWERLPSTETKSLEG